MYTVIVWKERKPVLAKEKKYKYEMESKSSSEGRLETGYFKLSSRILLFLRPFNKATIKILNITNMSLALTFNVPGVVYCNKEKSLI